MHERNDRNYGIDALRILSMMMVVVLHVLGKGGVLESSSGMSLHIAWLVEIGVYCAVDCYALITGYVCYGRRQHYARFFDLWFQVVFYCVLITTVFAYFLPGSVGMKEVIKAVMPVTRGQYWYFTAYAVLFVFIPYLNRFLEMIPRKTLVALIMLIILTESLVPTLTHSVSYFNQGGYGVLWLACLYVIGASIKILSIEHRVNRKYMLSGYTFCILLAWTSYLSIGWITETVLGKIKGAQAFVSYPSPLILFSAIFLFLFFLRLKLGDFSRKCVCFFAPLSFSVYLIHTHPLVFNHIIGGNFSFLGREPWYVLVGGVLTSTFGIYLICTLVDFLRKNLFQLCKIDCLSRQMDQIIVGRRINRVFEKVCCWIVPERSAGMNDDLLRFSKVPDKNNEKPSS